MRPVTIIHPGSRPHGSLPGRRGRPRHATLTSMNGERTMVITVTGSTGTIGRELVRLLSERGQPVRAVLRDFTKARQLEHVAWIQVDLVEKDKLDAVLAGTERLFLLTDNTPGFG